MFHSVRIPSFRGFCKTDGSYNSLYSLSKVGRLGASVATHARQWADHKKTGFGSATLSQGYKRIIGHKSTYTRVQWCTCIVLYF